VREDWILLEHVRFVVHAWRSWKSAKRRSAGRGRAGRGNRIGHGDLYGDRCGAHAARALAARRAVCPLCSAPGSTIPASAGLRDSYPDLLDYQQRTHSFDAFGVLQFREFNLTSPGQPQHLRGVAVTPSLASSLGVAPVVGRWFGEAASERGSVNLAVISRALWNRLGGDPKIVGQALTMDGQQYTVTGVMPAWFRLPVASLDGGELRTDVWVPSIRKARREIGMWRPSSRMPGSSQACRWPKPTRM